MDVSKELIRAWENVQAMCTSNEDWDCSDGDDLLTVDNCVEKQIPLQPFKSFGNGMFECLICNHPIKRGYNYCFHCGQRIEWNEEKWEC